MKMLLFQHYSLLLHDVMFTLDVTPLKTTMCYFYSTLAQSMAALFVVSGIFLIFRIEMIGQEINSGIDNFRNWVVFRIQMTDPVVNIIDINKEPHSWLAKDVLDHIEAALNKAKQKAPLHVMALTDYSRFISGRLNYQTWLKIFAFPPFVAIGLIFSNAIYNLAIIDLLVSKYRADLYADVIFNLNFVLFTGVYLLIFVFFAILGPRDWMINTPKTHVNGKRKRG